MISSKGLIISAAILLFPNWSIFAAETKVLKLATIAPDGSSWMKTLGALN